MPRRFERIAFGTYNADQPKQQQALDLCKRYAAKFDTILEKGLNLILTGNTGTGKTHLAVSILRKIIRNHHTGVFATVDDMLKSIRATYNGGDMSETEAMDAYIQPDLFVLDEVGVAIGQEEKRRAMVFAIINARYNEMRPTVIIGNLTKTEMEKYLGPRVWDRLREGGSPVVSFDWGSYRGKM